MFYTYLVYSSSKNIFYKGHSTDPKDRLQAHIATQTKFTAIANDWKLVYVRKHDSKKDAIQHELMLKRQNHKYFNWIIKQPENIVSQFLDNMG
jgi:putative endonuclease